MKENKKNSTKESINNAAIKLFSHKGYDGVGMREIAEKADIAVSVLYYYYDNKEIMYNEIVYDYFKEILNGSKEFIEKNQNKNFKKSLIELLKLFNNLSEREKRILKIAIYEIQGFGKKNLLRKKLRKLFKEHEFIFFHLFESQNKNKKKSFAASRVLFTYITSKISDIILKDSFQIDTIKDDLDIILSY
ncbi:MAG: TetR/AcrR family transcriptional regulator [Candidatus Mcinerneyibacterium aminivorans]|uniref:TetR/AcrR family transcriptional regulator n=1 Tax=Candidatus Mcinerneyibacterium aminivorans TaxID=2703815 RepID=A0A5D0MAH6_9BACT|nr:MAG: TetR/AcrR family transcriptional regulator [Candidatus Mcinerneyibacterium aminivorans]